VRSRLDTTVTTLVGGVGELFQGDLDLGRLAVERLSAQPLGPDVFVEELHYGAVAVAQRLAELNPTAMVLIGAVPSGQPPGTVRRRRVRQVTLEPDVVQQAVTNAVTGYVTIELVVAVATGFGILPRRTVVIEVEPGSVEPGEGLSAPGEAGLAEAIGMVRDEVRRIPLLELSDMLAERIGGDRPADESPAGGTLVALLDELRQLDETGRWGATFALRDLLRRQIADGHTGDDMEHVDWGLWWALLEELDRLQGLDVLR